MSDSTNVASTASVAKEQAAGVAEDAKNAGARVAGTAREETSRVAHEASGQARQLARQTAAELREQAATQQERVSQGLRSVGDELQRMADGSDEQGVASDVVRQVAQRASSVADWLGDRDPGSLLAEVKQFARTRPGVFIAIAAGAGVLAGRVTKSLIDSAAENASSTPSAPGNLGTAARTGSLGDSYTSRPPTTQFQPGTASSTSRVDTPVYEEVVDNRGGDVLP